MNLRKKLIRKATFKENNDLKLLVAQLQKKVFELEQKINATKNQSTSQLKYSSTAQCG